MDALWIEDRSTLVSLLERCSGRMKRISSNEIVGSESHGSGISKSQAFHASGISAANQSGTSYKPRRTKADLMQRRLQRTTSSKLQRR